MKPSILFTAFEPSGDAHAAPVIAALRQRVPDLPVFAWGGPRMEAAGATIVGHTGADAAMGLGAIRKIGSVRHHQKRIRQWTRTWRVVVHVAVDSPAANFPICRVTRRQGSRVVHLVAPQLWAWGAWRTRKLRRSTDLVLCLLPFEEEWFTRRDIPAKFIGHPRMNRDLDRAVLAEQADDLPPGTPRIGIFPGSRRQEVKANLRLLVRAFDALRDRHPKITGAVVAADDGLAELCGRQVREIPPGLAFVTGRADGVVAWSDLCLTVSGTMSLDIARQQKPMVGVYRGNPVSVLISKLLLRTPFRLLPNIIAEKEIVAEFVPYAGGIGPIVTAAEAVLTSPRESARQRSELSVVCRRYANKRPAEEAAREIVRLASGARGPESSAKS